MSHNYIMIVAGNFAPTTFRTAALSINNAPELLCNQDAKDFELWNVVGPLGIMLPWTAKDTKLHG